MSRVSLTAAELAGHPQPTMSKRRVRFRPAADPARSCGTCSMFVAGGRCTDVKGKIDPRDTCDIWVSRSASKSARTPMLEATPRILGPHGLWHTPDRHVGRKQKLPDYIEQVAGALMDQQGMDEQQAIATAVNAIKRWAKGRLGWGRHKITPEVIAASRRALAEWNDLKASHH